MQHEELLNIYVILFIFVVNKERFLFVVILIPIRRKLHMCK